MKQSLKELVTEIELVDSAVGLVGVIIILGAALFVPEWR